MDDGWRQVASAAALEENEVIYITQVRVFLVHTAPPLALSGVSSHVGERIAYCRQSSTFQELAHGSKWDRLGHYLDGPAPRGMDRVASRVMDGLIEVKITDVTEGPPRGAGPPMNPTGPFCEYENPEDAQLGFLA